MFSFKFVIQKKKVFPEKNDYFLRIPQWAVYKFDSRT